MLLAGNPGVGKSQVALDVAARITRGGEWPDGSRAPHGSGVTALGWSLPIPLSANIPRHSLS
jgi:hypothetical protein